MKNEEILVFNQPELSKEWQCNLFGSDGAFCYTPEVGKVPNFVIRWFMNVCLGCKWVRTEQEVNDETNTRK